MTSTSSINKKITAKGNSLENSLAKKLRAFYNKNIKPFAGRYPPEVVRQLHENAIKNLIRKSVQDAYLFGTEIVGEQIAEQDPDFQLFISGQDINNIQQLTERLNQSFWTTTSRLMNRESEFKVLPTGKVEKLPALDIAAAMTSIAVGITYEALNRGVRTKLPAVTPPSLPPKTPPAMPADTNEFNIELEIPFDIRRLGEEGTKNRIMFLTKEDAKVDPEICAPLNRNVYDVDDPFMPEPPLHNYCRCRLVPVVE